MGRYYVFEKERQNYYITIHKQHQITSTDSERHEAKIFSNFVDWKFLYITRQTIIHHFQPSDMFWIIRMAISHTHTYPRHFHPYSGASLDMVVHILPKWYYTAAPVVHCSHHINHRARLAAPMMYHSMLSWRTDARVYYWSHIAYI